MQPLYFFKITQINTPNRTRSGGTYSLESIGLAAKMAWSGDHVVFYHTIHPCPRAPRRVVTVVVDFAMFSMPCLVVIASLAILAAALAALCRHSAGTTLLAPCGWALASVAALTPPVAWMDLNGAAAWQRSLGYAAACLALCPAVALLGAKRPQHRAWQLVVLSLWIVLILPIAEASVAGRPLEVSTFRRWFIVALILVGAVNWLPTRYAPVGLATAAAQLGLFWEYLGGSRDSSIAGLGLVTLAVIVVATYFVSWRRKDEVRGMPRIWQDFRNAYGVLWTLRVAEQFNKLSTRSGWPVQMAWRGLVERDTRRPLDEPPTEVAIAAEQCLASLLGRFVSQPWIDQRRNAARAAKKEISTVG